MDEQEFDRETTLRLIARYAQDTTSVKPTRWSFWSWLVGLLKGVRRVR